MKITLSKVVAATVILAAHAAQGQTQPDPAQPTIATAPAPSTAGEEKDLKKVVGDAATNAATKAANGPLDRILSAGGLQLDASQANSNATLTLSGVWDGHLDYQPLFTNTDGFAHWTSYHANFTTALTSPISKASDYTSLATLDGLANSTNLSFKLGAVFAPAKFPSTIKTQLDACRQSGKSSCDPGSLLFSAPLFIVGGLSGAVGYDQHSFYDKTSLAKENTTKTPWSVGAYFGVLDPMGAYSLIITYQYQQAFNDQGNKTLCPTSGSGPTVSCVSGAIGAPTTAIKDLLSLEGRWIVGTPQLSGFNIPKLGFGPKYTYDARAGSSSVDIPIYFVQDESKGLTGGLRFSWASDTHHTLVGLFIAKPFQVASAN